MSFGRPGGLDNWKVSPPQRGSFPLDHDGECKTFMQAYMRCIKANAWNNGACRPESRAYLECRMDHGLMQRDDMANLGLGDVETRSVEAAAEARNPAAAPLPGQTTARPAATTATTTATPATSRDAEARLV